MEHPDPYIYMAVFADGDFTKRRYYFHTGDGPYTVWHFPKQDYPRRKLKLTLKAVSLLSKEELAEIECTCGKPCSQPRAVAF